MVAFGAVNSADSDRNRAYTPICAYSLVVKPILAKHKSPVRFWLCAHGSLVKRKSHLASNQEVGVRLFYGPPEILAAIKD